MSERINDSYLGKESLVIKIKNKGKLVNNYPTHENFCEGNNFEGCYEFEGKIYDLFIIHGWLVAFEIKANDMNMEHRDREAERYLPYHKRESRK